MDNFTAVTRDAIEHMVSIRGADMDIPDLSKELAQWATECKCLEAGVLIQLPDQLNCISAPLPRRRSRVQTPAGPTLRVLKQLRRMRCLCYGICKWLDILVFSDKDEKP